MCPGTVLLMVPVRRRRHRGYPGIAAGFALGFGIFALLHPAFVATCRALDGLVNSSNTVLSGRAGPDAYRQRSWQSETTLGQAVTFNRNSSLRVDGRYLRERQSGRAAGVENDYARNTARVGLSGNFRLSGARFSFTGDGSDQRTTGAGADIGRVLTQEIGTSVGLGPHGFRLAGSGNFVATRRDYAAAPDSRNEEISATASVRTHIPWLGGLGYRFSTLVDRNLVDQTRDAQTGHVLSFAGHGGFAGGRGRLSVTANSNLASTEQRRPRAVGDRLRLPFAGGYLVDYSPEDYDPLEGGFASVPALYDGTRDAATVIDIGDAAPGDGQYHGQYRNIQYDFGEEVQVSSAILYVDRTPANPALAEWSIFVTSDPESLAWRQVDPGSVDIGYREWGTGLRGWTVTLSEPVATRFYKMVDVKNDPTTPELRVTELEVYVREEQGAVSNRTDTANNRFAATFGYAISPAVQVAYSAAYRRRTVRNHSDPLQEMNHGLSASWTAGAWSIAGRYAIRTLGGRGARTTDVDNQSVTVTRKRGRRLASDLSWGRTRNRGQGLDRVTNNLGLAARWQVAPAMELQQRVTAGRLSDETGGGRANSMAVVTSVNAAPYSSLTVNLQRTYRWSSRAAGAGYTGFNDTNADVTWRPVSLILLESQLAYYARTTGEWITRNTASWTPLTEGRVKMNLSASHYRETKNATTQRSGGITVDWAVSPNVTVQGSVESVVLEQSGQENRPANVQVNGTWRF